MKLIIQIPCLNEKAQLPEMLSDLPREIAGVDETEILIIDDGSVDGTSDVARENGVHHIVRFTRNRGLSAAFSAGLDACLRLGADIIVNTDADNQYPGREIARLIEPILAGRADIVIGDRQTDSISHFSPLKKLLQRWGSRLVREVAGTSVTDATSGFRALSRRAASRIFVHNRFTYTLEMLVQAGATGLVLENVPIKTNPQKRESRLFKSIPQYLMKNGPVIFRTYAMYRPVQLFGFMAAFLFAVGAFFGGRFVYFYLEDPQYNGHIQSLVVGVGCVILSFMVGLVAMLSDLLAANRRHLEELTERVRRLDARLGADAPGGQIEGVESTKAPPWRRTPAARDINAGAAAEEARGIQ